MTERNATDFYSYLYAHIQAQDLKINIKAVKILAGGITPSKGSLIFDAHFLNLSPLHIERRLAWEKHTIIVEIHKYKYLSNSNVERRDFLSIFI